VPQKIRLPTFVSLTDAVLAAIRSQHHRVPIDKKMEGFSAALAAKAK